MERAGRAAGAVVVVGVETRCGPHSTCTLPRSTVRYPVALDPLRSALVLRALRGTGIGTVVVTLKLAASSQAGARLGFTVRPG